MCSTQPSGAPRAGVHESPSYLPHTRTSIGRTQLHGSRRIIAQYSSHVDKSAIITYQLEVRKPHPLSTSLTHTTSAAIAAEKQQRAAALVAKNAADKVTALQAAGLKMDPFNLGDQIRKVQLDNHVPAIPYLLQVNVQRGLPEFPYENLKTPFERHEVQHLQYMTNLFNPDRFDVLDCKGDWKASINKLSPVANTNTPKTERAKAPSTNPKAKISLADYKKGKQTGTTELILESTHSDISVKPVPRDGSVPRNGVRLSPVPITEKVPFSTDSQATNVRTTATSADDKNRDDNERRPIPLKPMPKSMEKKNMTSSQSSTSTPNKPKRPLEKDDTPHSEKRAKLDDSGKVPDSDSKYMSKSASKTSTSSSIKPGTTDSLKKSTISTSSKITNGSGPQTPKPTAKPKPAATVSKPSPPKSQKTSSLIPPPLSPTLPPTIGSPSPTATRGQRKITPPKSPKPKGDDDLKSPVWSPLSIPPELSPTLPSPLQREIDRMNDEEMDIAMDVSMEASRERRKPENRERSDSQSSESDKKSEAHRLSTIERHERSRQPGAPGVAQKLPRGKHPAKHPPAATPLPDDDDEEEEDIPLAKTISSKETKIIKIKYKKRQAKLLQSVLKLPPRPSLEFRRLEAERLSSSQADNKSSAQKRPPVNGTDKVSKSTGSRKLESSNSREKPSVLSSSRNEDRRSKDEPKSRAKEVEEKSTSTPKPSTSTSSNAGPSSASKRTREAEESLPPPAKRLKRPSNLDVSKPSTPVTPAFKSPGLAPPTSSQKGPADTPQKKAEDHRKANIKYAAIALLLKREMDRILHLKEHVAKPLAEADKLLGCVVGLECIVAYMTAFGHVDDQQRLRHAPLRADDWLTTSKLLYFLRNQAPHPELRALAFMMGAIIYEQLDAVYASGVGNLEDMRKNSAMRLEYWQQAKKLTQEASSKLPLGSWSTVSETVTHASSVLQTFAKKNNVAWSKKIDF